MGNLKKKKTKKINLKYLSTPKKKTFFVDSCELKEIQSKQLYPIREQKRESSDPSIQLQGKANGLKVLRKVFGCLKSDACCLLAYATCLLLFVILS